MKTLKISTEHV